MLNLLVLKIPRYPSVEKWLPPIEGSTRFIGGGGVHFT